jgi:hypothetical protein
MVINMSTIIENLNAILAPFDAQVLESAKEDALRRRLALLEFKQSEEYQNGRKNAWEIYPKMFDIAGGKTWFSAINNATAEAVEVFVKKNCAAVIAKRNARIADKLKKSGVTEVLNEEFVRTADGLNGIFVVNTDKGQKRVVIEAIFAGGYNIQCAHIRILVKIN